MQIRKKKMKGKRMYKIILEDGSNLLVSEKHGVYGRIEQSSPVSIIMMLETVENNSTSFQSEKENKGAYLNPFEITQVMPEIFEMVNSSFVIKSNLSNLILNSNEQDRILLLQLIKNLTNLRGVNLYNDSHYFLNSSKVIALPEGSFLASLSSLINSSFNESSSTGYQSILSQNSWSSSESFPVLRNSSKILFLFNFSLVTSDQFTHGNLSIKENNLSSKGNVMLTIYNSPLFSSSSNFINLDNFSIMPSFATSGQFISGILSNLSFNSFGMDTVNLFILKSPFDCVDKRNCVYIYKSFGFSGDNRDSNFSLMPITYIYNENNLTRKLEPARLKALLNMGIIYELTTATGRSINTTGNHPYLTPNGWIKVAELKEGDYIAVQNKMLASTIINLICYASNHEDIPYLLARLPLYSPTSFEKSSSESLLFFNISSTTLNNNNTLSSAILTSPNRNNEDEYLNLMEKDIFWDGINTYLKGNVGIGTGIPAHALEVAGSMNISGDLNVSGTLTAGTFTQDDARGNRRPNIIVKGG